MATIISVEEVSFPFERYGKTWIGKLKDYKHYVYSDDCCLATLDRVTRDTKGVDFKRKGNFVKFKKAKLASNADTTLTDNTYFSKKDLYDYMVSVGAIEPVKSVDEDGYPFDLNRKTVIGRLDGRPNSPFVTDDGYLISSFGIMHSDLSIHHKTYACYYCKRSSKRRIAYYYGNNQQKIIRKEAVEFIAKQMTLKL